MSRRQVQIHNNPTLFPKATYSGSKVANLDIVNGARIVFTMYVSAIDPGAQVNISVKDSFSQAMPPSEVLSWGTDIVGHTKRVLSDFHNLMDVELSVTGGSAEVILGMSVYDNALQTRIDIENAEIDVDLNHKIQPNGTHDSVRVGDGVEELAVNPDGSINVNIVDSVIIPEVVVPTFASITGVLKDVVTTIVSYTAPIGKKTFLQMVEYGGGNTGKFWVEINNVAQRTGRTYFGGQLKDVFDYDAYSENGLELTPGDIVKLQVEHYRPASGDFEGYIQALEIG